MAKDKLTQYDSVASNNLDVGGISIAEGMLPSNVNNAMREQLSHLADFAAGTSGVNVLKFQDDTDTNSIKIQAPAAVTTTTTLTLPDGAGSANQSLTTNGSGTLSWSTRIGNVVEDTTPQLGGNLDTNGNNINFGDNVKATFGDAVGGDLQIYHNSTDGNSFIDDAGTGALAIRGSQVNIAKYTGETMAQFVSDGAVNLFYNDSKKISTTASGIDVQGSVTADGLQIDGDSTFEASSSSTTITKDWASLGGAALRLHNSDSTTNNFEGIVFTSRGSTSDADQAGSGIFSVNTSRGGVYPTADLDFYTTNGAGSFQKRMSLD